MCYHTWMFVWGKSLADGVSAVLVSGVQALHLAQDSPMETSLGQCPQSAFRPALRSLRFLEELQESK